MIKNLAMGSLAIAAAIVGHVQADIVLDTAGVAVVEDFNDFRGNGFSSSPSAGQLDSETYRVTGLSDGDGTFGGTHTTGDFARGESTGGETTGGVYAFEISTDDYAAGVQPTGSDMTPGDVTIRVTNNTGEDLNFIDVRADALFLNDADRSTRWTFEASLLDIDAAYQELFFIDSTEAADTSPAWSRTSIGDVFSLGPIQIADGQQFFIRITGDDLAGSGSRDEFAMDNLSITGLVTIPEPGSTMILFASMALVGMARRKK